MLPPLVDQRGILSPELIAFIQGLADQLTPIAPPVSSVDGRTGAVTLADLYDASGTAGGLVASHEGAVNPHPQYALDTDVSAALGALGSAALEDVSAFDSAGTAAAAIAALAAVASSGAYSDLTGRPSLSVVATSGAYTDLSGRPTLATVATSGAYADLSGRPSLGTAAAQNTTAFDAAGAAATAVAAHEAASDPHPTYTTATELASAISGISVPDEVSMVRQGVGGAQTLGTSAVAVSSLALPAVQAGTVIEHIAWGSITNSSGGTASYTPGVRLGSSIISAATPGSIASPTTQNWWIRSKIHFITATTQEVLMESFVSNLNTSRFNMSSWTEDGSTGLSLDCLITSGSAGASQTATRRSSVATIYLP